MTRDTDPTIEEQTSNDGSDHLPAGVVDGRVGRRDLLRATGALGVAGLVRGMSTGRAAAQSDGGGWEAAADSRIEDHRMGDLEVVVEDGSGRAIPDAQVSVSMQEHDFHFGTAVNADMYVRGEDKNGNQVSNAVRDKYRRVTNDLFNTAVLENAHKWAFWERDQERADAATERLLENGFDVRGHVCIWGRRDVGAIPQDVNRAIDDRDAETIRERSMQHIEDIISHYGDDIMEWEVVNEAMAGDDGANWIQTGVYGDRINREKLWQGEVVPWKSPIMADWYQKADEVAPDDVGLAINDFNVLTAEYDFAKTWFPNWAQHIQDSGVDLAGMGMQSHMKVTNGEDRRLPPERLMADLNHFAEAVPDTGIRITEFDFAQSSQQLLDERAKAEYFRKFLKTTFSHPAVEQFLMWGFWDDLHWSPPHSPLFDSDFEKKPGYDVWTGLVYDEWWTEESGTTDSSGTYATSAFLGEHEITVSTGAGIVTERVSLEDSDGTTTVTVTATGTGGGGTDAPGPIDGATPTDPDGDGYYEDLNGNGNTDYDDVVTYFQNMEEPAMTDHTAAYDYNDNGRLDYTDLVDLFRETN